MHILIVDNNKTDLIVNRDLCEAYGHKVDAVTAIDEAINILKKKQPDVALIEISFPENSGLALVEKLSQVLPKLPVYILTEGISVARAVKAMKLKALDILYKPLDAQKLKRLAALHEPLQNNKKGQGE